MLKEITITTITGLNTVIEIGAFDEIKINNTYFYIHRKDTPRDDGYIDQKMPISHIKSISFNN